MFRLRMLLIGVVFTLAFLGMLGRLAYLQILHAEAYRRQGESRLQRLRQIPPARGRILDRRGRVLAEDRASFDLWIVPASPVGRGRAAVLRSNLGELSTGRLMTLAHAYGAQREFEERLARQYLQERSPLVRALVPLLREKGEREGQTRARLAERILEGCLQGGIDSEEDFAQPRRVFRDVPMEVYVAIRQARESPLHDGVFNAIETRIGYARVYPAAEEMGHITGYVGNLSREEYLRLRGRWGEDGERVPGTGEVRYGGQVFFAVEPGGAEESIIALRSRRRQGVLQRYAGYFANETVGRTGIEQYYNQRLRGRHALRLERLERPDPRGPRIFVTADREVQAERGEDLYLTLDLEFQTRIRAILRRHLRRLTLEHPERLHRPKLREFGGAVVLMNANNGQIYALVSEPTFDPNTLGADFPDLLKDPGKPLINRVIAGQYPPGSTVKPMIALAALHEGLIRPDTLFTCERELFLGPRRFVCMGRHGSINVADSLKSSCNIYYYHTADRLGPRKCHEWLSKLGFGHPTGIDLAGEAGGHLPPRAFTGVRWSKGETYHLGIGQGAFDATPLQLAVSVAVIANGGDIVRPHLLHDPLDPRVDAPVRRIRLDPLALRTVREGMRRAVQHTDYPRGTAAATARIEGFEYAVKTGSAQHTHGTHAWIVGYAPFHNPEVVLVVLVPFGNHGGATAGPIAKDIVMEYFGLHDGPPPEVEEEEGTRG